MLPSLADIRDTTAAAMDLATAAIRTRAESSVDLTEDNSSELVGISIAFAVLTTLLLAVRFYAKRFQAGGLFADEIFLLLAWFVNLGMCALGIGELAHPRQAGASDLLFLFSRACSTYHMLGCCSSKKEPSLTI